MPVRRDELLPYLEPVRRLRQNNRPVCSTMAVAAVALAALARWMLEGSLISGVPFITFFPAVIVVALIGRVGPGLCSVILSVMTAKYFFIPPYFALSLSWADGVAVSLFTVIAAFDVLVIAPLNEAIERLVRQEQNARIILDNSPAGMIAVDANGVITVVNNAVKKLFGYEDNELIGQHIELLVPARIRAEHVVLREMYLGQATARAMGVGRDLYGPEEWYRASRCNSEMLFRRPVGLYRWTGHSQERLAMKGARATSTSKAISNTRPRCTLGLTGSFAAGSPPSSRLLNALLVVC